MNNQDGYVKGEKKKKSKIALMFQEILFLLSDLYDKFLVIFAHLFSILGLKMESSRNSFTYLYTSLDITFFFFYIRLCDIIGFHNQLSLHELKGFRKLCRGREPFSCLKATLK